MARAASSRASRLEVAAVGCAALAAPDANPKQPQTATAPIALRIEPGGASARKTLLISPPGSCAPEVDACDSRQAALTRQSLPVLGIIRLVLPQATSQIRLRSRFLLRESSQSQCSDWTCGKAPLRRQCSADLPGRLPSCKLGRRHQVSKGAA